jgi:hypothetical protein
MANQKIKKANSKKLHATPLKPLKTLKTTTSALQIDGLKGESTDSNHKDWIE